MIKHLSPAVVLILVLAHAPSSWAERQSERGWQNPFSAHLDSQPGRLVLNLQVASLHNDGVGLAVGYVPWGFLEAKVSYAYWTEHTLAGLFKFNILPRATLTPYIPVGYTLGLTKMRFGLTLYTHQLFAGAGLQARFLERFFLAGEFTANVTVNHQLQDQSESYSVVPSDWVQVRAGFMIGVYLL